MSVIVRREVDRDREAIHRINRSAFGGDAEAKLVDALRESGLVEVSLVADLDGMIVGHILFSRVKIKTSGGAVNALSLAPMAVLPSQQRKGIGTKLVESGLNSCRDSGHRIVVVLGHPD